MHYVVGVAVINSRDHLFHDSGSVSLTKLASIYDFVEEFTALDMVLHNVEAFFILEVLINLDDVGVVEAPKRVYLVLHGLLFSFVHVFFF